MFNLSNRRKAFRAGGIQTFSVNSADLDGSTQNFQISSISTNFIDTGLTLGSWVKVDDNSTPMTISRFNTGITDIGLVIDWSTLSASGANKVTFAMNDQINFSANSVISTTDIMDGGWHSVIVTYDGSTAKMYIDSVEEDSSSLNDPSGSSGVWRNMSAGAGEKMQGGQSFSFCHDRAITPSEISEYHKAAANTTCFDDLGSGWKSGLKFFHDFGNWSGHTSQELVDQSGNGLTATNVGSISYSETGLDVDCTP